MEVERKKEKRTREGKGKTHQQRSLCYLGFSFTSLLSFRFYFLSPLNSISKMLTALEFIDKLQHALSNSIEIFTLTRECLHSAYIYIIYFTLVASQLIKAFFFSHICFKCRVHCFFSRGGTCCCYFIYVLLRNCAFCNCGNKKMSLSSSINSCINYVIKQKVPQLLHHQSSL